jgi:outer membrane receptor protein involved in Fe transport
MSPTGLILSGPLAGTTFTANGQTRPFQFGQLAAPGNLFMIGGEGYGTSTFLLNLPLAVPLERYSILAHADFDITDHVKAFGEVGFGRVEGDIVSAQPRNFVPSPTAPNNAFVLARDNPYLPASLVAQMTALNLPSVSIGRISNDLGPAVENSSDRTWHANVGLSGDMGGVKWNWHYQYGRNRHYQQMDNTAVISKLRLAVDAVRDSSGAIVCRSTLTNPGNGCVPLNVVGENQFSPAAKQYVMGSSFQLTNTAQHSTALNFQATPFNTWAGPVAMAAGVEYRQDTAHSAIDPISAVGGFQVGNTANINGKIGVKEVYFESQIPLAKDMFLAKSLDINGAVRRTDYTTSGAVTTWKIGANWEPTEFLRLRATRSRDIRAANIQEVFSDPTFVSNALIDPRSGQQTLAQVTGGGNRNLHPEIANTSTIGLVFTPQSVAPGLRLSVDYFNIDIDGAIATFGAQNIISRCFQGVSGFCPLINNGAGLTGPITSVFNGFLNVNSVKTSGIDIEAMYELPLSRLAQSWQGDLTFRLLATHVSDFTVVDSGGPINRAGQTGVPLSDLGGVPSWTVDGVIAYDRQPFAATLQVHYISPGKFGALFVGPGDPGYSLTAPNSISDNTVEGRVYLNLAGSFDIGPVGKANTIQLFASINNLLDSDPPIAPGGNVTNPIYFDVIGRTYNVGVRMGF